MAGPNKSGKTRHSYVQFYPSDWLAGTARMPRLVKSVYFDICLYNWDKAEAVPESEVMLMLADLEVQGDAIVDALVKSKKLVRDNEGSVYCQRAIDEAERALGLWTAKSKGGKNKPESKENDRQKPATIIEESSQETSTTLPIEPEPEPEVEPEVDSPPTVEVVSQRESDPSLHGKWAQEVVEQWNTMAVSSGLTQVAKMVGKRPAMLKERISEHGHTAIIEAIKRIPESPFLTGVNDRMWKANFDWLIRPHSCAKLIEGGYHNQGEGIASAWRD